jgi:hypothetical protein
MERRPAIATVINYCTNEDRFLDQCIAEASTFSAQIIVSVCDHLFDGTPEDAVRLLQAYERHPECLFVEFTYDPDRPYGLYCPYTPTDEDWAHYWHSTGRYVGYHSIDEQIEYILFLDVDEIVDAKRFMSWLDYAQFWRLDAARFLSYFYFRSAEYRASPNLPHALLVRKSALGSPEDILSIHERQGLFEQIGGLKFRNVLDKEGKPLVDHYSWVRTKEELLLKTKAWGHRSDRDWKSLIEEEFNKEFTGTESMFNLTYEKVVPRFDPFAPRQSSENRAKNLSHVKKIDSQSLNRELLRKEFLEVAKK